MDQFTLFADDARTANLADKQAFGSIVRDGRALSGMSLRDAAELFRTAPGTVSRWENGHTAPPLVARRAIRDLLVTRVSRIAKASHRIAVPA